MIKKAGHSQNFIASLLNRRPSTISLELCGHQGLRGYRPAQAQRLSDKRRRHYAPKAFKLCDEVRDWIKTLFKQELSPRHVVNYLKRHKTFTLHHETVYQLIYDDKSMVGELYRHLRIGFKPYRKRYGHYDRRGKIIGCIDIEKRLGIVDSRPRIGD